VTGAGDKSQLCDSSMSSLSSTVANITEKNRDIRWTVPSSIKEPNEEKTGGQSGVSAIKFCPSDYFLLSEDRPASVALACISSLGQNGDSFKVFHICSLLRPKRRNSLEPIDKEEELRKYISTKMASSPTAAISDIPAAREPKHPYILPSSSREHHASSQ
jgi:hypothetical protein